MDPTAFVIPCLLAGVALYALTRRVDVYAALRPCKNFLYES